MGDLTWNYEKKLVCPDNLIGTVDLYQTTHHGLDRSNSPQFVWSIQPRVAVMNNGPRKGGPASVFEILRKSPGIEDIWQGHLALGTPKEVNTDEKMIANLGPTAECTGNLLKVSVAPDGKYTLTNAATDSARPTRRSDLCNPAILPDVSPLTSERITQSLATPRLGLRCWMARLRRPRARCAGRDLFHRNQGRQCARQRLR